MTLDEAIKHCLEKAEEEKRKLLKVGDIYACSKCAEEHEQLAEWLEELKEYEELEEQGLLLKLPCKIGDYIYVLEDVYGKGELEITEYRIECMRTGDNTSLTFDALEHEECLEFTFESMDIGRTVFLSYAEAEQELKRMECAE
jgi:hypothetical protein